MSKLTGHLAEQYRLLSIAAKVVRHSVGVNVAGYRPLVLNEVQALDLNNRDKFAQEFVSGDEVVLVSSGSFKALADAGLSGNFAVKIPKPEPFCI